MLLNLAINYGGRAEIVDAVNAILESARLDGRIGHVEARRRWRFRPASTRRGLPDPDLLIRTSGEMRISNFLLWQIAYAELYVTETLWPDFRRTDLLKPWWSIRSATAASAASAPFIRRRRRVRWPSRRSPAPR